MTPPETASLTDINIPEVVAEITTLFEDYEAALTDNKVSVLDATFWQSESAVRFGPSENGFGYAAIHAARLARRGPAIKERRLRTLITTFGFDVATVHVEFKVRGRDAIGRQSQTFLRLPGIGWKVVSAHVSVMGEGAGANAFQQAT